jgi:hypothetical protein
MSVKMGLTVTRRVRIVIVDVTTITLHNFPGVNHEAERNTILKKEENDRSGLRQCLNRYCKLKRAATHTFDRKEQMTSKEQKGRLSVG